MAEDRLARWCKTLRHDAADRRSRRSSGRRVPWRRLRFEWLEERQLLALASSTPTHTLIGLNGPQELAINSHNDLYVSNVNGTTVSEFTPGSTTPTATLNAGLTQPQDVALDSSGDLFVSNEIAVGTVSEFAPGSTTASLTLKGLNYPIGIAIDSHGDVFVANYGNGVGLGGTGATVSEFAPGSTMPTATLLGLDGPFWLTFDSSGNLYVTNQTGNTVSKFAPGATTPSATLLGLGTPDELVFGPNGNLYVTSRGNNTVSEFLPGHTTPSVTLTGLDSPRRLAFDSIGDLYVSNTSGNTVSEFAPGSTTPTATLTGLNSPFDLAFDSSGDLFVANEGNNTVSEFAASVTPPVVTTTAGALSYVVRSGPQVVDPGISVTDEESLNIASATIAISSGYSSTTDALGFAAQNGITGSFNSTTGTLTLTGTTNVANYQAALRSITFSSSTISSGTRTVSFVVNDGTAASAAATRTISLQLVTATHLVVTTQPPATVTAGAGFGFTVAAEDSQGTVVTGYSGSVTVALASNPGSSTLAGTLTATVTNGLATFSGLSLNRVASGYALLATSSTLTSGTSSAIAVTPGAATQLLITTQPPSTVTAATDFGLTVTAEDAEGNLATSFSGSVTVGLANNPGSGTLGGTTTASATGGVAAFSTLTLNKAGTGYTLSLASPSLASATSNSLNIIAGVATQLVVAQAFPTNVTVGAPFGFTASAEDAEGNVTASYSGSVSVALTTNPGSSTLSGTTTVSVVTGLAVFSGLALNHIASGYQLSLTANGLSATTVGPFNVTALGVATHLVVESAPPATVAPGAAFGLTVEAEDDFGTVDTSFNGNVAVALASNPGAATLSGTLSATATAGVATFTGLSLNNPGTYTLQATSNGLTSGTTNPFNVVGTLTINGTSANNSVQITFIDTTDFQVVLNGGPAATYSTATATKVVYNGPSGTFSELIFADQFNTYTATQSFSSTDIVSGSFEFVANNVLNLYIYAANGNSTATVNVGTGSESNFYVGDAALDYSYIGDPAKGIYSELSGFASETITGSGGTTYAYVYSTSHAAFVGDPGGSTLTATGIALSLNDFPQVYAVGAADGTDNMTLHTEGGSFVGQPSFSYVSGTFQGAAFEIGAAFAANVTAQATNATDSAFFYSYAGDTFSGAHGTSSLNGSAAGFANFSTFVSQATGFQSVSVLESGAGTDVANLTSPGNGTFTETATASTLAVGGVTAITVNTFFDNNGNLVAVPSKVNITGNADGSDTANLYDAAGSNALVAQGNKATLTTAVNTVGVTQFGKVNAFQQNGTSDTVHQQSVDFALQTIGNWTSV